MEAFDEYQKEGANGRYKYVYVVLIISKESIQVSSCIKFEYNRGSQPPFVGGLTERLAKCIMPALTKRGSR